MASAVALAFRFPGPGRAGGELHPELLTKLGVALIFFLNGVSIPTEKMKASLKLWRLHLLVQVTTFGVFPLLGWLLARTVSGWLGPDDLTLGIFYLSALPSTVSSSVALTAAAKGNVPAAVFNASLSSILGIFLTPLLMSLFHGRTGEGGAQVGVLIDMVKWLLLPLVIGQLCRPWLGTWAARNRKLTNFVDRSTIVLMVYTSFCDSVTFGIWHRYGVQPVVTSGVISVALFFTVNRLTFAVCNGLGFPTADRSAAVLCASKKSLVSGIPMAHVLFRESPALGLILLPIMLYHPIQLLITSALVPGWARIETAHDASPA